MSDILTEFEQQNFHIPARVRLIGVLRLFNLLFCLVLLSVIIIQVLEMKVYEMTLVHLSATGLTAVSSIIGIFSIFYSIPQVKYELTLNPNSYQKNKFRWCSIFLNFFVIICILSAFITLPNTDILFPKIFIIIFSLIAIVSGCLLVADLIYIRHVRKKTSR